MRDACIALLSDFGSRDVYAGVMKGVIATISPRARLIDLTHEIPAGDVRQAAFRLWQARPHMPPGTIFLAVVDPGVGTSRRPLAIRCEDFSLVGPDNGIFTYLLGARGAERAVEITNFDRLAGRRARRQSSTFHGRDIFAAAAGLLALGSDVDELGPEAGDLVKIPLPRLVCLESEESLRGETMFQDRFGNYVTSIGALARAGDVLRLDPWVPGCPSLTLPSARLRVQLGDGRNLPLVRAFADVPVGSALAYVGSDGLLEIGVNQGSAADSLSLTSGMEVVLAWG